MIPEKDLKLVDRIVVHPKGFRYMDPKTGERRLAKQGEGVRVTVNAARNFAKQLKDPAVKKAQEAAAAAIQADAVKPATPSETPDDPDKVDDPDNLDKDEGSDDDQE